MNKALVGILSFISGAAISGYFVKKYCETKYNQELEAMKTEFKEELHKNKEKTANESIKEETKNEPKKQEPPKSKWEKSTIDNYRNQATRYNYTRNSDEVYEQAFEKPDRKANYKEGTIETIPESEFGEDVDYERISLTYYILDDYVCDEDDSIIETYSDLIGYEALDSFGEYGNDDYVYVKNDILHTYYEISKETRPYHEVVGD